MRLAANEGIKGTSSSEGAALSVALRAELTDHGRPETFAVSDLHLSLTPRFGERDAEHVKVLAERLDDLPPIVVHRPSLQVVDGVHRVLASRLMGRTQILATVLTGSLADAYVVAVQANVSHGKPLSMAERRAAVRRILDSHDDWSDRRIAEVCGVAVSTVAQDRPHSTADDAQSSKRVGRDGRWRPTNPAAVRENVAHLLAASPDSTLRDLAKQAGTSQATVLDVKRRLLRGDRALPPRLESSETRRPTPQEPEALRGDSALSSAGLSSFGEWFSSHCITEEALEVVEAVPVGRVYILADEAHRQARIWEALAAALERRARRR